MNKYLKIYRSKRQKSILNKINSKTKNKVLNKFINLIEKIKKYFKSKLKDIKFAKKRFKD